MKPPIKKNSENDFDSEIVKSIKDIKIPGKLEISLSIFSKLHPDSRQLSLKIDGKTILYLIYQPHKNRLDIQNIKARKLKGMGHMGSLVDIAENVSKNYGVTTARAVYVTEKGEGFWEHRGYELMDTLFNERIWVKEL